MKKSLIVNLIMYFLIFVAFIAVARIESKDWNCEGAYNFLSKCQEEGNGAPYKGSNPSEYDSCSILLGKIDIAAKTTSNAVNWRRSFVVAVIISLLIYVLVITPSNLPAWTQFYLVVFISAVIIYYNLSYYDYHMYNTPRNNILESTAMVEEKIERGEC